MPGRQTLHDGFLSVVVSRVLSVDSMVKITSLDSILFFAVFIDHTYVLKQ